MPTYDYRCGQCGHTLELFQSITESPKKKCPACKKLKLKRIIGAGAGFIFKGSGFYQTDYRSESYKKAAAKDKASSEPSKDTKDSKKSDTPKPAPAPKKKD